jgi:hypothetical protein
MFKFDENYENLKQVEKFYPEFKKLYDNITEKGNFAYNYLFEGKIKGIEGEDEKTAIYLLQNLETQKNKEKKIKELLENGFNRIDKGEGTQKFNKIVIVGTDYSEDSTKEFENVRIMFKDENTKFIIPKGYSKRGLYIYPDRLIFAK